MDYSTYFLLLEDSCATQIGKIDQAILYVSAGSLWIINDKQDQECQNKSHSSASECNLYLKSCELINVYLSCPYKAVLPISEIEFELLLAVDSFAERKKISTETSLLQIGRDIYDRYLDQFVSGQMCEIFVTISNHPGLPDNTCGLIQYVGSLPSCPGIWFGVKLPFVYRGFGATDGSFEGKRFFECDENCGLFLSIEKISIYHPHKGCENLDFPDDCSSSKSDIVSICEMPVSHSSASTLARLPLELGERIVWISDDGPELGTVRWIGVLPDAKVKEYTIGVEFDRPIGTGTGKYNNEQLFRTAQNHASLIPAIGLMKAEEFFGSKEDVPEPSMPDANFWADRLAEEKPNFNEAFHSPIDQSEMGSSGDSASQHTHQPSNVVNQASKVLHRPVLGSADISPSQSTDISAHNLITDGSKQKCIRSFGTLEHCYENVEKDETGRILNRDSNAFQVAAENHQSDYLDHNPHVLPTSFHRSFDNIYAENKRSKFSATNNNSAEYDRVDTFKSSEVGARHAYNDAEVRSRTLETYSTARSYACKVFDENDVPLRLPYTTGRSTFYGRADDESLHANTFDSNDESQHSKNLSSSSNKPHRSIFKFISKRTPNIILQQLNKTFRNSFLPPSFHRRSSSDSAPTLPERSSTIRGSLIPFNSSGCSVTCRQLDEEGTFCPVEAASLPCDGQSICLKVRNDRDHPDVSSPMIQSCEVFTNVCASTTPGTHVAKSSQSAVTFQPRPSSSIQPERNENASPEFDIGSQVEVDIEGVTCYGMVRWMGCFKNRSDILVGIELEEEHQVCTDGKIGGRRFFSCPPGRAYFAFIHSIRKDCRLFPILNLPDMGPLKGVICPPLYFDDLDSLTSALNTNKSAHFLACSVTEVVLFSMFTFCQAFDSVLLRGKVFELDSVIDLRQALLKHVINPLRCGLPINISRIEQLYRFVHESYAGPTQFYNHLMQSFNADPQIVFSSGSAVHVWNISVEKDGLINPSVQQLLELSLFQANLKFRQVPNCLVLHLQKQPRDLVIPSFDLDITDMLQNSLRECNICGKLGTSECRECFEPTRLLSSTVFCNACSNQYHSHIKRSHHRPLPVEALLDGSLFPSELEGSGWADKFREKLELCAVVCSHEFHHLSFMRTGLSPTAPWMFFSSCSLEGESRHVHPQVGICSFLPDLISQTPLSHLIALSRTEMSPLLERFLFSADIYIYQFPSLLLYK